MLKNPCRGSLLKKAADARRAQATAEAYVAYTPHKGAQRATQQMPLFQQTAKLVQVVKRLRRQGKRIAFTNGCFDLLHAGHLDTLERTKRLADVLVVGVNSDASVCRLKGPGRPVVPQAERARLVAGLKPVDYVTLFSEPTPIRLIRAIRPDVLTKGADWKGKGIVGELEVKAWGGKVVLLPFLKGHSTTGLIRCLRSQARNP